MTSPAADIKPAPLRVRVGLSGGTVHIFDLSDAATLRDVADAIRKAEKLPETSRIRLICVGRLFTDHSLLVTQVAGSENVFLHAAISEPPATDAPEQQQQQIPISHEHILQFEDEPGRITTLSTSEFERLIRATLSDEDVANVSVTVLTRNNPGSNNNNAPPEPNPNAVTNNNNSNSSNADADDNGDGVARLLESTFVFSAGREGTNADFLIGCIYGYLLGVIVCVLLLDSSSSRRWRIGLIAGTATNCAFGILRTSLYLRTAFPTP